MDEQLVQEWGQAFHRGTYCLKAGTLKETRAAILRDEAQTYGKLAAALGTTGEMAARVMSVQATAEDTNTKVQQLQTEKRRAEGAVPRDE